VRGWVLALVIAVALALAVALAVAGLGLSGSGPRLKFASDFSGSRLNTKIWGTCYPWANAKAGCSNFGNKEYEWYLPSQVRVSGGVLHLVAQRIPTLGQNAQAAPMHYSCRSGMVTTYPGFRFKYGYVQVVAQVPGGPGLWPALWLLAANLRWPPEMDMLEHYGPPDVRTNVAFHPAGAPAVIKFLDTANLNTGWHTFGLSWTSSRLVWFIDGRAVLTASHHIPHQPMYLIANLAAYQPPAGGQGCEGTMLIRSIKVWQN
jgi:beta-glucanase (GH16 family)